MRTFRFFAVTGLLALAVTFSDTGISKAGDYRQRGYFGGSGGYLGGSSGYFRGSSGYLGGSRYYGPSVGGYRYNRSGPIYHAPSVHFDRVYHHEYYHWTPSRGLHSHGHFDAVPHYVPGHFDYRHRNHIHTNPHFHHR